MATSFVTYIAGGMRFLSNLSMHIVYVRTMCSRSCVWLALPALVERAAQFDPALLRIRLVRAGVFCTFRLQRALGKQWQ